MLLAHRRCLTYTAFVLPLRAPEDTMLQFDLCCRLEDKRVDRDHEEEFEARVTQACPAAQAQPLHKKGLQSQWGLSEIQFD